MITDWRFIFHCMIRGSQYRSMSSSLISSLRQRHNVSILSNLSACVRIIIFYINSLNIFGRVYVPYSSRKNDEHLIMWLKRGERRRRRRRSWGKERNKKVVFFKGRAEAEVDEGSKEGTCLNYYPVYGWVDMRQRAGGNMASCWSKDESWARRWGWGRERAIERERDGEGRADDEWMENRDERRSSMKGYTVRGPAPRMMKR